MAKKKQPEKKYKIAIALPSASGTCRTEVTGWVANSVMERFTDPDLKDMIEDVSLFNVQRFPTNACRNVIVQTAQQNDIDILFQIDDDADPDHNFFKRAIHFLVQQKIPSVIGCPYLSSDYNCQVFRFSSKEGPDPSHPVWEIVRFPREEAIYKKGIERVGGIGSHTICYDMRVFNHVEKPYYHYNFDRHELNTTETEEMYLGRRLTEVGIPLYVDWNCWSGHFKNMRLMPLMPILPDQIPDFWLKEARDYYLNNPDGIKELQNKLQTKSK